MEKQELIVALGAVIGAVISGMQIFSKWREEQRQDHRLYQKLQQAEKRVSFLDTWRKTQATISPQDRQQHIDHYVARELDILMVETLYTVDSHTSILESSRRWMLLFMPRSIWGWMGRFGFFLTFPMFLLFVPFCMSEISSTIAESQAVDVADGVTSQPAIVATPEPDFGKMTIQEQTDWVAKQNRDALQQGALTTNTFPLMSDLDDDEYTELTGFIAILLFFGSISLCCYLTAVLDGRDRKKYVGPQREPLPTFLRYLEHEIEIVEEDELDFRAA
ncbi:hypothetical protein Pla110_31750 [Polystyrenella longa]|uniref:Uncharacterized protein n=1 Tax=Polystyrenella longa TaxID=2528007 RepID=A0A518CQF6_9PLAN|nr:hypothetical protein [Polystyrenella longa]QDU81434.1 hypothetical protein Pla110_31750 [Polystyrenella longa]